MLLCRCACHSICSLSSYPEFPLPMLMHGEVCFLPVVSRAWFCLLYEGRFPGNGGVSLPGIGHILWAEPLAFLMAAVSHWTTGLTNFPLGSLFSCTGGVRGKRRWVGTGPVTKTKAWHAAASDEVVKIASQPQEPVISCQHLSHSKNLAYCISDLVF